MTDKTLEDKAVEILDASQQAIGAFGDKLAELAKQYGPEVADAALQMARIDAASGLLNGFSLFAGFIVVAVILRVLYVRNFDPASAPGKARAEWRQYEAARDRWLYSHGQPQPPKPDVLRPDDAALQLVMWFGGGAATVFMLVPSLVILTDLWRWVGVFEPKLWLAKRILGL